MEFGARGLRAVKKDGPALYMKCCVLCAVRARRTRFFNFSLAYLGAVVRNTPGRPVMVPGTLLKCLKLREGEGHRQIPLQ
jgi:hypothetical protein